MSGPSHLLDARAASSPIERLLTPQEVGSLAGLHPDVVRRAIQACEDRGAPRAAAAGPSIVARTVFEN